jgi:hypothetical protein
MPKDDVRRHLPYLDKNGDLVIPLDAPRRYRWWQLPAGTHLGDAHAPAGNAWLHEAFAQAWACAQFGPDGEDEELDASDKTV